MLSLCNTFFSEKDLKKLGIKKVGKNVKISSKASIYGLENISIGNNVRIDDFVVIIATGPLEISNYVSIHNFCFLGSRNKMKLNDFVTLAPGVKIFTSSDDYEGNSLTGITVPRSLTGGDHGLVELKKHVIIGSGSIIMPNIIISEGASVGALSLVKTNLDPWNIYAGVPVKFLRKRKKELLNLELKGLV
jgi:galactoside O-acetyltransferase